MIRIERYGVSVQEVSRHFISFKMQTQAKQYWLYQQQSFVAGAIRMHADLKCNRNFVWQWLLVHKETTPMSLNYFCRLLFGLVSHFLHLIVASAHLSKKAVNVAITMGW